MREPLRQFEPRETPTWMYSAGQPLVMLTALAIWGVAAWATFEILRGRVLIGVLAFVVWLPIFVLVARELHRRGRVRFGVSITTTALVVLATGVVVFSSV